MSTERIASILLPIALSGALLAITSAALSCDVRHRSANRAAVSSVPGTILHETTCVGGLAAGFPCRNVDLVGHLPLSAFAVPGLPNPATGSMVWGYTDAQTGQEYALMGLNNSLAVVRIDGAGGDLQLMGRLPTHSGNSIWRDVRVYKDHAFIGSDSNGPHGIQVLDLRVLRTLGQGAPIIFSEAAHYSGVRNTHTIAINEASGFAYLAGTNTCSGGIHILDIRTPTAPVFAGCFSQDGYTHETHCWNYQGPDAAHTGKEICLASDVDSLLVVDASNKAAPIILSAISYPGVGYVHQAWFTEDFRYALLNDELDEQNSGQNGKTYVFDYSDLDAPVLKGAHTHPRRAIDHNLYIKNNFVYESNYTSGLRILALTNLASAQLTEVGFFDIFPANDNAVFDGNWGNYPFFASGRVALSGIDEGLFVVRPTICTPPAPPPSVTASPAAANQINLSWASTAGVNYNVQRAIGGCGVGASPMQTIASGLSVGSYIDSTASGGVTLGYRVQSSDASGTCGLSASSACVEVTGSGGCSAPPRFNGVVSGASAGASSCTANLSWVPAAASCADPLAYTIYRSAQSVFTPSAANAVAEVTGASGASVAAPDSGEYNYIVRAKHRQTGAEESNLLQVNVRAAGPLADSSYVTGAELGDPILSRAEPLERTTLAPNHVGWHISAVQAHTGQRSYESTIGSNYCLSLNTPEFTLSPAALGPSVLSFWTKHGLPSTGRDGGTVEMSIDGGTWLPVQTGQALPGTITTAGNACGLPIGRPVFNGTQNNWGRFSVDLSAVAGQKVRFRFLLATGSNVSTALSGWFIDDVELTHAQLPGSCSANNDTILLQDGFEG